MKTAMYEVREADPFVDDHPITLTLKPSSPRRAPIGNHVDRHARRRYRAASRNRALFPKDIDAYLANIDSIYVTDAYHSLSIEGYKVSRVLVDRVRTVNCPGFSGEQSAT